MAEQLDTVILNIIEYSVLHTRTKYTLHRLTVKPLLISSDVWGPFELDDIGLWHLTAKRLDTLFEFGFERVVRKEWLQGSRMGCTVRTVFD